mmetsp:Transcript_24360/g.21514  ORF Transcript_24360/g.21514 Transcript_24360/m.21514 type:complete len:143 (+) Transcript_24360:1110-1538(+)
MIDLAITGGGSFTIRPYESLEMFTSDSVICHEDEEITVDFTQSTGPSFDIFDAFLKDGSLVLPECTLEALSHYTYSADVYYTNYPSYQISINFDISVDTEEFAISVEHTNDEDYNAVVTVTHQYINTCPYTTDDDFSYDWSC